MVLLVEQNKDYKYESECKVLFTSEPVVSEDGLSIKNDSFDNTKVPGLFFIHNTKERIQDIVLSIKSMDH